MKRFLIVFLLLAVGMAAAQSGDEEKVVALENVWNQAELHLDAHAIESILTDNFVLTTFDGSVQSKAQYLASVRDKDYHPQILSSSNMKIHLYGTTAIVTGEYHEKGMQKNKPFEHRGHFTDTWVKVDGKWLCAASQLTEAKV